MDSQGKTFSIRNAAVILSADVFYHPLWLHFNIQDPNEAASLADRIKSDIKYLTAKKQWLDACRAEIICAYLQNLGGNGRAAIKSLHHTRSIAAHRGFSNVEIWASWGASAVCLQDKAYQKSAEYLLRLEKELNRISQWILADLINLVRQAVLEQVDHPSGMTTEARAQGDDEVGWLYKQLLCWGNPTSQPEPGIWVKNNLPEASSLPDTMGHLAIDWRTFWNNLRHLFRSEVRPPDKPGEAPAQASEKTSQDTSPELPDLSTSLPGTASIIPVTSASPIQSQLTHLAPGEDQTPSLAIYCLGSFKVFMNNHLVDSWNGQKGISILKYLIANRSRPVAKDILMYLFWPDADAEVARRNLHQAIYGLRQTMRRALPDLQLILFENDCYRINPEVDIWLDIEEFEMFIHAGRDHLVVGRMAEAIDAFGVAEELYRGDFLEEELYDDWPQSQREYFRTLYLEIAGEICAHFIKKRQTTPAVMLCQKVLARDHCNEQAYRALIQCYLIQGQRQLAIREYQVCVQMLKDELGLSPSEETLSLYRQITVR